MRACYNANRKFSNVFITPTFSKLFESTRSYFLHDGVEEVRKYLMLGLLEQAIETTDKILLEEDRLTAISLVVDSASYNARYKKILKYFDYLNPRPDILERILVSSLSDDRESEVSLAIAKKMINAFPYVAKKGCNLKNAIIAASRNEDYEFIRQCCSITNFKTLLSEARVRENDTNNMMVNAIIESFIQNKDKIMLKNFVEAVIEEKDFIIKLKGVNFGKCITFLRCSGHHQEAEHIMTMLKDLALDRKGGDLKWKDSSEWWYNLLSVLENDGDEKLANELLEYYWTNVYPSQPDYWKKIDTENIVSCLFHQHIVWKNRLACDFFFKMTRHQPYLLISTLITVAKMTRITGDAKMLRNLTNQFIRCAKRSFWSKNVSMRDVDVLVGTILHSQRTLLQDLNSATNLLKCLQINGKI